MVEKTIFQTSTQILESVLVSYDVASGSEIMPCNKIYKPLVVYIFGKRKDVHKNVAYIMTKLLCFYGRNEISMGLDARKTVFRDLRTTKAQTSLRSVQSDQRLVIRLLENIISRLTMTEI